MYVYYISRKISFFRRLATMNGNWKLLLQLKIVGFMRFVFTSKRVSNFFLSASTLVEGFFSATHVSKSSVNLHTSSIVIFNNSQVVHSSREIFHFFVGMWTFKDLPSIKSNQILSNTK